MTNRPPFAGAAWLPRRSWPLALLVAAGLLVPVLTRRSARFPPSTTLEWALAGVLALALISRSRSWRILDPVLAALVGVAAAAAHLAPGLPWGHDTKDHLWAAWAYLQAWRAGDLLPIWLHHLALGMPMPLFYGPLAFWAMAPAAIAGGGAGAMLASSFVLASVVAALLARQAVFAWTRDRRAALVAAVAFAFAPYRLCDANYRLALGETWSVALLPLVLLSFHRLVVRRSRRDFALAALAAALVTLAHPISLVALALVLPLLWARAAWTRGADARRALLAAAHATGAAACGLALAGFFTVPLLVEKKYLDLTDSIRPVEDYVAQGVFARQLVDRQLWDALRWSEDVAREADHPDEDMPFYVGIVALTALAAAALAPPAGSRALRVAAAVGALGVGAVLAATLPAARWFGELPGIPALQFPWRFLGPASAAAALAAGLLVARSRGTRRVRPLAALAAIALLVDGFASSGAVQRMPAWKGLATYEFTGTAPARVRPVRPPGAQRVVGPFLPPEPRRDVSGVADLLDGRVAVPYREYITPPVRQAIEAGDWSELAVDLVATPDGALARHETQGYARFLRAGRRAARAVAWRRGAGRIAVTTPASGGTLVVAEQYFLGWQVRLGGDWQEARPGARGLLETRVPRGVRAVEFRFDRWTTDRRLGWIVSGVALALLLASLLRREPRRLSP